MRTLTLREWSTRTVTLTRDEIVALTRACSPWLQITPTTADDDAYELLPTSNKVGVVRIDEHLTVFIEPAKCPASRVVFMMSYALGAPGSAIAPFAEQEQVWDAMVQAFLVQLERALRHGTYHHYRVEEAASPTIRGRIRTGDQLARRYRLVPPVEISYDDYTDDILENRILKAALRRCQEIPVCSAQLRRALRTFEPHLGNVSYQYFDARSLPPITWTRLNEHYRPAVNLAQLILKQESLALESGPQTAHTFLVDMAEVFEAFVVAALRDALGADGAALRQGARLPLDEQSTVMLEPDFSLWGDGRCCGVGDVKYKHVTAPGVIHPDLYQVLAYTVAADLPVGFLVYAEGEGQPVAHRTRHIAKELRVRVLELTKEPAEILSQIRGIAEELLCAAQVGRAAA